MKLVYQIPNKLYYIQNFLDYRAYKQIHYDVFRSKRIKLNSVEGIWDDVLFRGAAVPPDKANLIDSYEPLKKFKILLKTNPFCPIKEKLNQFMHHSLKDGASINWHADAGYEHGITYYINRRWNSKFGGELLFKDDTANVKSLFPQFTDASSSGLSNLKKTLASELNGVLSSFCKSIFVNGFL